MRIWMILSLMIWCFISCEPKSQLSRDLRGVGPITSLDLPPINDSLMNFGKQIFEKKCSECHTMEYKNTGPDISDILAYRHEEWVANFLLNKNEMLQRDSLTIMTRRKYEIDCGARIDSKEEAFAILEYLRQYQIWLHEFNAL